MKYQEFGDMIIMRLDPGDEIMESVVKGCEESGVTSAVVTGIGASSYTMIRAGDETKGEYETSEYNQKMEIASIMGSVTMREGKLWPHLHVSLAGTRGLQVFAGHLEKAVIFSICEIYIKKLDGTVERKLDEHGWWVMDL